MCEHLCRYREQLTQIDSVCCLDDYFRYSDQFRPFVGELDLFSLGVICHAHISADTGNCDVKLTRFVLFMSFSDISTEFFDLLMNWTCFHCVTFLMVIFGSFEDMRAHIDSVWLFHWFVEYSDRLPRSAVEFGLLAFRYDSHRRTLTDTAISWFRLHSICLFDILTDFLDLPRIEFVFIPRCSYMYLDRQQQVSSPTPRHLHLHLHQTTAATTPQLTILQQHQWMYRCRRTGMAALSSNDHLNRQSATAANRLKFPPLASFPLIS